jgi:Zn-dependent protease with chaperone function
MARYRLQMSVWLLAFLVGLVGNGQASAHVQKASETIADSATSRIVETLPDTGLDLPVVLSRPQDVYLLVTAGAAYTDVRVLALPAVDPHRMGRALADAETGTSLAGTDVGWSADDYSAAQLVQKRGRLGLRAAVNSVPLGALADGLQRDGFVPHVLLRVPVYAAGVGLPPAPYSTRRFRWYDSHSLGARPVITVRAGLSAPLSLWPLALFLLVPLNAFVGMAVGNRLARDERQPLETCRRRFRIWTHQVPFLSILLVVPILVFVLRTSTLDLVADLWLASSNTLPLVMPLIVLIPAVIVPLLITASRREVRLFGKAPAAVAATWLTEEEKALQQRMNRWKMITHFLGVVVIGAALFLLPHKSSLSSAFHSFYQLFVALGAALVSLLFRKQVAALTKRTLDDDLTFRARRFGQLLGVRPRDVWVEDSSRASHFAVCHRDQGDHIVVSRKMRDTFTDAEMDFVLAAQVARMVRKRPGVFRFWLFLSLLLMLGLPIAVFIAPGASGSAVVLSPWFLPVLIGVMLLPFIYLLAFSRVMTRDNLRREEDADRQALEVTGDLAAAQSALSKTDAEMLPPLTGAAASSSLAATQSVGRLTVRRQALLRTNETSFG